MKELKIALAGNPNCGKTTIFNSMTGANQKVGNWGGVTVDIKEGFSRFKGRKIKVTDLPGTYSLTAYSQEEVVARDFIIQGKSDVIIDVIDATNLERNLYLALQIIEMGKPIVFAFNMSDEVKQKGIQIDTILLSKLLGAPIRNTIGRTNHGVSELIERAVDVAEGNYQKLHTVKVDYGKEIEKEISRLTDIIKDLSFDSKNIALRWYAVKLLEADRLVNELFSSISNSDNLFAEVEKSLSRIMSFYKEDAGTLISEQRYGFIKGAIRETVTVHKTDRKDITEKIDKILLNRWLAYPLFAFFMWLLFQATFVIGGYPLTWIENLFEWLAKVVTIAMAPSTFRDLLVDGIIGGVGSVIVFLPNIMIMFFGISILEDTGYMARIAFLMDKFMHKMGLHGKSFIPLLMGVGCSVPAIMAARTLESRKDRILTILVTPLITCSARLPVYILFAGAFFPKNPGNVIFIMYVLGFFFSFIMGLLFRKTLFRKEKESPFVMEMPPYRVPTFRSILIHMWEKAEHYLKKMGGVVLFFSVVIWFMGAYPKTPQQEIESAYDLRIAEIQSNSTVLAEDTDIVDNISFEDVQPSFVDDNELINQLEKEKYSEMMKSTYIGQAGRFVVPVLKPAGFDWRMGVSLITGFVAKEVVVSTIGVLFNVGEEVDVEDPENTEALTLTESLRQAYTPLQSLSFMLFVLLYTPCIVALVTLIKELKSWKWSLFSVAYQITLAWIISVLVYQIGSLFNLGTRIIGG